MEIIENVDIITSTKSGEKFISYELCNQRTGESLYIHYDSIPEEVLNYETPLNSYVKGSVWREFFVKECREEFIKEHSHEYTGYKIFTQKIHMKSNLHVNWAQVQVFCDIKGSSCFEYSEYSVPSSYYIVDLEEDALVSDWKWTSEVYTTGIEPLNKLMRDLAESYGDKTILFLDPMWV